MHHANSQREAGVAVLVSDKADLRAKTQLPELERDIK